MLEQTGAFSADLLQERLQWSARGLASDLCAATAERLARAAMHGTVHGEPALSETEMRKGDTSTQKAHALLEAGDFEGARHLLEASRATLRDEVRESARTLLE